MGLFDWLGFGGSTGGVGIGSSLFNTLISDPLSATMDSLGLSQHGRDQVVAHDNMVEQMHWQSEEAQKNRDFAQNLYNQQLSNYPSLLKQQNDAAFNLWKNEAAGMNNIWKEQFGMQNQYNAPSAQVRRLLQAGINPSSVFGGQGQVAVSTMGSSSPPPQSAASPIVSPVPAGANASPVGIPQGITPGITHEFSQMVRNIAEARKLGADTSRIENLLNYEISDFEASIAGKKLANELLGIQSYIAENTKNYQVAKSANELLRLIADIKNVNADTSLKVAQEARERAEKLLADAKKSLTDKQYEELKLKVDNWMTEFNTRMNNIRSDTARNYSEVDRNEAQVELFTSQASLADAQAELTNVETSSKGVDAWIAVKTKEQRLEATLQDLKAKGVISEWQFRDKMQELENLRNIEDLPSVIKAVKRTLEWTKQFIPLSSSDLPK